VALTPLANEADFNNSAYADLANYLQNGDLTARMLRATRACESHTRRRLAPFTGLTETSRLQAVDVDDSFTAGALLPAGAQIAADRAASFGYTDMVRHLWVREYPPLYPELWTGQVTGIVAYWSYGNDTVIDPTTAQYEPDTGHVRLPLGVFTPPGTTAKITYSGGYTADTPDDLVEACIAMAAHLIIRSLDPMAAAGVGHDPDIARSHAESLLQPYHRNPRAPQR